MKKIYFLARLLTLIISFSFSPQIIKSDPNIAKKENVFLLDHLIRNSEYILGPGDKLDLRFIGENNFNNVVDILNDGTISLPIVGDFYIAGMTKKMAEKKIKASLSPHLIQPDVQVLIKSPRNIRIAVMGEVMSPGIYSLTKKESSYTINKDLPFQPLQIEGVPTLIDAIQKSGGFSNKADLSNILLKRKIPSGINNINYKFAYADLLKLLEEGDFNQNPFLFDGDVISVSENLENQNKPTSFWGNLSPDKIKIFIAGEVKNPGLKEINADFTLTQAILAAGGPINFRTKKTNIKILSENKNGAYSLNEFKFELKNNIENKNLPKLNNGDVIYVGSSDLSKTGDFLNLVTTPFFGMNQVLKFFKTVNNNYDD